MAGGKCHDEALSVDRRQRQARIEGLWLRQQPATGTFNVFIHVVSGAFVVDVEGQERRTFASGEVYHEGVHAAMRARNPSSTQPTTLILFQVGGTGDPPMLLVKPPRR